MLPFLIATHDLEPDAGSAGVVCLPYDRPLELLGRPNLESGGLCPKTYGLETS